MGKGKSKATFNRWPEHATFPSVSNECSMCLRK